MWSPAWAAAGPDSAPLPHLPHPSVVLVQPCLCLLPRVATAHCPWGRLYNLSHAHSHALQQAGTLCVQHTGPDLNLHDQLPHRAHQGDRCAGIGLPGRRSDLGLLILLLLEGIKDGGRHHEEQLHLGAAVAVAAAAAAAAAQCINRCVQPNQLDRVAAAHGHLEQLVWLDQRINRCKSARQGLGVGPIRRGRQVCQLTACEHLRAAAERHLLSLACLQVPAHERATPLEHAVCQPLKQHAPQRAKNALSLGRPQPDPHLMLRVLQQLG
mmetsp:Transcript_18028/g.45390  ORF Transcript_18028/g.45390 Transcript_18028/m.45390 type:complete len:268 (-) Transcript_18028:980-1783(-)